MAVHRLAVALQRLLVATKLPSQTHDGPVGLELRERLLQQLARLVPTERIDEVDGHVVRRPEAGPQRVRTSGGEPRDVLRVEARGPEDDAVALDVDAATAGSSRQLRVFTG